MVIGQDTHAESKSNTTFHTLSLSPYEGGLSKVLQISYDLSHQKKAHIDIFLPETWKSLHSFHGFKDIKPGQWVMNIFHNSGYRLVALFH